MENLNYSGAQQGWQCPICKTVYSPFTPMCYYCGEAGMTKTSTGTGTADVDWQKQPSVTIANHEIRWTDKVWLDAQGNLKSMDGCPTDRMEGSEEK